MSTTTGTISINAPAAAATGASRGDTLPPDVCGARQWFSLTRQPSCPHHCRRGGSPGLDNPLWTKTERLPDGSFLVGPGRPACHSFLYNRGNCVHWAMPHSHISLGLNF